MKVAALFSLVVGALAQNVFEPENFNITQALLDNGVSISALPNIARSSNCAAAVSLTCFRVPSSLS